MQRYANRNGDSGVTEFEIGADYICVRFRESRGYIYSYATPGKHHVEQMKALALAGRGLGTYINQHVRQDFAGRE